MSDKDKLLALLAEFHVEIAVEEASPHDVIVYGGYSGFFTQFEFDEHGVFRKMGAWE